MKAEMKEYMGMGIILIAAMAFFYFILGLAGMVSVLGIFLLFIAPMHLILDNFELSRDEKTIFSFFIGVGILPSLAYWIGLLISFKIAILASFIVLIIIGFFIRGYKGGKHA